eukprot:9494886-Pyramimonas_sp.AAC.1
MRRRRSRRRRRRRRRRRGRRRRRRRRRTQGGGGRGENRTGSNWPKSTSNPIDRVEMDPSKAAEAPETLREGGHLRVAGEAGL